MRVLLAGVLSFCIITLGTFVIIGPLKGKIPDSVTIFLLVFIFFLAIFISSIIFNKRSQRWPFQTIEALEDKGLITSQEYKAKRAFQIEEFEDEGNSYYIELEDGKVLFLSGQYLYDYKPIDDDPKVNQKRKFPCTEFLIKRHKTEGYVLEIVTGGVVIEPEDVAPHFTKDDYRSNIIPVDGEIIQDKSFDEIKRERLKS